MSIIDEIQILKILLMISAGLSRTIPRMGWFSIGYHMIIVTKTRCRNCQGFMDALVDEDGYEVGFYCWQCSREYLYE